MEILKPTKDRFILLCVCPSDSQNPFIKFRNRAFSVFYLIVFITFISTSGAYILKNLENDLEGCLLAILTCSAAFGLINMIMAAYFLQYQVIEIFSDFQVIYDKCK